MSTRVVWCPEPQHLIVLIDQAEEQVRHLEYELAKERAFLAWLKTQKQLPRDSA